MQNIDAQALKELILEKLSQQGFVFTAEGALNPVATEKEALRHIHRQAAQFEVLSQQRWLRKHLPWYLRFFADGDEVVPEQVSPELVSVTTTQQHCLFRIARLLWSIPLSSGFGRRLRFLVFDRSNGKLMGILALQSPPISFSVRDRLFRYPPGRKTELVNQTMDIHVLGAVPPYNDLLAGKLIALAAASNEVRLAYKRKYAGRVTEIERRTLPLHLVALTTTSAFGRSSIYNRLKYKEMLIAESIGFTKGYGAFHLAEVYSLIREFMKGRGFSMRDSFYKGPRPKWQIVSKALAELGLPYKLLHHGVKREVFLFRLVDNLEAYIEGRDENPAYRDLPFTELVAWWRERWLLPRAERTNNWRNWRKEKIRSLLLPDAEDNHTTWQQT